MSTFKRYQSKVFSNYMVSHDLETIPFAYRNNPDKNVESHDYEISCIAENHEEEFSNLLENSKNITVIHVPQENNDTKFPYTENDIIERGFEMKVVNRNEERKNYVVSKHRSAASSLSQDLKSQDLKSQDSGFSDSDRSDYSETNGDEMISRYRRRRRKKIKKKGDKPCDIKESFCFENGIHPNPTCTSTPKNYKISNNQNFVECIKKVEEKSLQHAERSNNHCETDVEITPSCFSINDDEFLGDFLYTIEPPEDATETRNRLPLNLNNLSDTDYTCGVIVNCKNYSREITSSVRTWLSDLIMDQTANECCITLQTKSLPRRREIVFAENQMNDLKTLTSFATAAASKLIVRAEQFNRHYQYIFEKVSNMESSKSNKDLLRIIEEDAFAILSTLKAPPPRRIQQFNLTETLAQLDNMKNYVNNAIDTRLDLYIERIVRGLEEVPIIEDSSLARGILAALTALGLAGPRVGSSIARCSGVRILLTFLISSISKASSELVAASLRALSSICCSATAIEIFIKNSGLEIVTDLLSSATPLEKEKMEAVALVVQITAPWTDALGLPYLECFAHTLVPALNRLVESTNCGQTLLLTAAALNQMSKSENCATIILKEDTIRKLLKSVKKSVGDNVWLMEQVASLVDQLARIPNARQHLAEVRASVALVCFLRMRPPGLEDAAYKRLETTAAAALTRLCVNPEIARQVVAVGGADCLSAYGITYSLIEENGKQNETRFLKYTKSLRQACKKAAKQIDIAKADYDDTLS